MPAIIRSSNTVQSRRLKILLWGNTGTRKSETPLRHLPNVLAIDTEGNLDQVIGMPEIPEFLLAQTKDVYEILAILDDVAIGKIKMPDGGPVQTVVLDTISVLWAVRQEVGALNAEKRVAGRKTADEATMTQLDWVLAKRPMKRLMTRLANLPVPFLILVAREKDAYETRKKDEGTRWEKDELVKVGTEPDAVKGVLYEVNLALHLQYDPQGQWFAQVDKAQGELGKVMPVGGVMRDFPKDFLLRYVSQVVQAGALQDDAEVAARNLAQESQEAAPRTQAGLVQWALETHHMDGTAIGLALKAAGITAFQPERWDEMIAAIAAYAQNGQAEPVAGD